MKMSMKTINDTLDYIALDFETANHHRNSACAIGLVRFIDGKEADSCYSLIHPAKMYFIPEWTETIHHISYDDVRNKPLFPEVWDTMVMPFINQSPGIPLVAHNGNTFDMPVIRGCCEYFQMEIPKLTYFDSLLISRKTWPEFENHKLTYVTEQFGIKYTAHNALDDARACGIIISMAADKWKCSSVDELLEKCRVEMRKLQDD